MAPGHYDPGLPNLVIPNLVIWSARHTNGAADLCDTRVLSETKANTLVLQDPRAPFAGMSVRVPGGAWMREGHRHLLKQQCHHTPNGGAEGGGAQDGYPVKVRGAGTFGALPRTPD